MFETQEERNQFYWSKDWRDTREYIRERDNNECQHCRRQGLVTTANDSRLIVDHIKELEQRPDLRLDPSNLEVLCFICHEKKHDRFYGGKVSSDCWDDEWW
ncbi:HNH endonuclease [Dolosigranulum pigrum]|nr:MAG TPA_asm: HNH endonuclease [Caudoviricetes sp.]